MTTVGGIPLAGGESGIKKVWHILLYFMQSDIKVLIVY